MISPGSRRPLPSHSPAVRAPGGLAVLGVLVFAGLSLWSHFVAGRVGLPLVHSALLAVHEAGHVVLALFMSEAGVYGGTLFQLLFPVLFMHHAMQRGQATALAASGVWLGESLLGVAAYMADARARNLPLVSFSGEGAHDWETIFSRWGLLQHDLVIANLTRAMAVLTMAASAGWLLVRWRTAARPDPSP